MTDELPQTYGERLLWAMKRKGLSQSELARRIEVRPQSVQHLVDPKKNAQGSSHTAALAAQLEVSSQWLATGQGSPEPTISELQESVIQALGESMRGKVLTMATGAGKTGAYLAGVAHLLSQTRNTESLPRIRWEDLMTADLRRPFELDVIDDALAPEIFRGCVALMDPSRPPEPGWPVLVRDRDNNFYVRDYKVGVGSRWGAVPRPAQRDVFDPLDSEIHGLTIIAAMDGYKRPRAPRG